MKTINMADYVQGTIASDIKEIGRCEEIIRNTKTGGRLNSRFSKKKNCRVYYHISADKKERYVSKANIRKVYDLQRKRFAEERIKILKHNIKVKEGFCMNYIDSTDEEIMQRLPITYRMDEEIVAALNGRPGPKKVAQSENPYKREQLNKLTSFGLYVRTKGELLIAEELYRLGIEFYYERALKLKVKRMDRQGKVYWTNHVIYPDFTIILPNGNAVFWEHKGMMSHFDYVARDVQREIDYNTNGIYQSHNLMVSSDGPENEVDLAGIKRLITGWLLPLFAD